MSGYDIQIGLSHVRADERDEGTAPLAKPDKELAQARLPAILDDK